MRDFTKEYNRRDLFGFLLPIVISELFQEFYGMINTAVISRYLTWEAIAVTGACRPFLDMQDHVFVSMTAGFGVYISTCIGSRDEEKFQKSLTGAVYITLALALGAAALALFPEQALKLVNVPEELVVDAERYLRALLPGCLFVGMKNLLTCTIQGFGDTKFISVLSAAGVITHTALAVFLVAVVKMGVEASALAVLLNQAFYVLMLLIYLRKKYGELCRVLPWKKLEKGIWRILGKNGLSKSGMTILVGIGSFILQYVLNTMSPEVIAGYSYACGTLNGFFMQPLGACAVAASVISAQNAGGGNGKLLQKYNRELTKICLWLSVVSVILCIGAGKGLLELLAGKEAAADVIKAGNLWLYICSPAYFSLSLFFVFRNVLQTLGSYKKPVFLGLIKMIVSTALLLTVPFTGYTGICISVAAGWHVTGVMAFFWYKKDVKGMAEPDGNGKYADRAGFGNVD